MWVRSSLTRHKICVPLGAWSLNHWATREIPIAHNFRTSLPEFSSSVTTVFTFPCVSFQIFYAHTRPHMYMYFSPSFLFLNTNGSKGYILFCPHFFSLTMYPEVCCQYIKSFLHLYSCTILVSVAWVSLLWTECKLFLFFHYNKCHCNTYPIINVILHTCTYYNQFPEGEMLGLFQTALQQDSTSSSAAATFPSAYI